MGRERNKDIREERKRERQRDTQTHRQTNRQWISLEHFSNKEELRYKVNL